MNTIRIVNNRVFDMNLISEEEQNIQLKEALNGTIKLDKCNNTNIKKILIYVNPYILKEKDIKNMNDEIYLILKDKYKDLNEYYNNIFETIMNLYSFLKLSSLSELISYLLKLNAKYFNKLKEFDLIPNEVIEIKEKGFITDEQAIFDMIKLDSKCVIYISKEYEDKEKILNYIYDNKGIFYDEIFEDLNVKEITDYKLIYNLILECKKTYRYFDHNIIDKEMVKELFREYNHSNNYKLFCSDPRFYKYIEIERNDAVSVISKYIELTKQGSDYIGLCPFHEDHNPSLRVSPRKNVWRCFSCGASGHGGDSFKQKYSDNFLSKQKRKKLSNLYKTNIKDSFYYYLYENLPENLKRDDEIILMFLNKDGCIFKLLPKDLKNNETYIDTSMKNDITSIRYFINNKEMVERYVSIYPVLKYYIKK